MTPIEAQQRQLIDELKTVIREAIDEESQNVEGGGKVWICGLGIVTPDNPEMAKLDDLAFYVRNGVSSTVMRRIDEWLSNRK